MNSKAAKHYKKWKYQAPIGLIFIGAGVCLVTDAAIQKYSGVDWWVWVGYGTLALVILNSGLSIFVNAALHRIRYEDLEKEST